MCRLAMRVRDSTHMKGFTGLRKHASVWLLVLGGVSPCDTQSTHLPSSCRA